MTSFDLVSRPWLPVLREDGTTAELSLDDVFRHAAGIRRLVGDLPTQELALLRLLLAILYDALDGPEDIEDWEELWEDEEPFAPVAAYLERHRDRFDLLHPRQPFFQVAGLHTEKDEVFSLNRIVADVPNGDPFFSMRQPSVNRLSFAEAARWLVHAHAFDPSGIKSGAVGDPRVKPGSGKGYPLGVALTGNLGGVFAEGDKLQRTLLLNLIAADNDFLRAGKKDAPAWRRPPSGPGPAREDLEDLDEPRPSGPRDLYTWQSRRARLHFDADGVTGVVLGYGDPKAAPDMLNREPMTAWRRSPAQEKKLGGPLVYLPLEHDPARSAWRGLAALLPAQQRAEDGADQRQEAARTLPPGVVQWLARLANREALPARSLIRTRVVGAKYGTQQSVIDEVVDDSVNLPVVLLHEERPDFGAAAVAAVGDADSAVWALGQLAGNLARAAGADPDGPAEAARNLGFAALDTPYRQWLASLATSDDPRQARAAWQVETAEIVRGLGKRLLDQAPPAAAEGRFIDVKDGGGNGGGTRWVDDTQADLWFRMRLNRVLPAAAAVSPDGPPQPPSSTDAADADADAADDEPTEALV
ncbi:type I-E CRISPR-associated protein Cse1/CasA [Streptomyces sp. HPF1205]|uniref:type I-E CRISPR-associated protein Cse1/CasA n=1 Tax=Streptomyces sp. HPF1205 TaxID=2873262 RepID=UPI001CEDD2AA|nr:type I-E CRISPR-associated protein Cse1/CasA [Streptomyces sp. HPF1205]